MRGSQERRYKDLNSYCSHMSQILSDQEDETTGRDIDLGPWKSIDEVGFKKRRGYVMDLAWCLRRLGDHFGCTYSYFMTW